MLKRLFLVLFILQSFAVSAIAEMDMSQLNQAEKSKMQTLLLIDMNETQVMCSSSDPKVEPQMHSLMDCSECDQNSNCHDLMCSSIHATTSFYLQTQLTSPKVLLSELLRSGLTVSVQYSNSHPETPPPSI